MKTTKRRTLTLSETETYHAYAGVTEALKMLEAEHEDEDARWLSDKEFEERRAVLYAVSEFFCTSVSVELIDPEAGA